MPDTTSRPLLRSRLFWFTCLALLIPVLYLSRVESDSISGLFGVFWTDEGTYLLSAKHQALFGQMHFFLKDAWMPELIAPLLHHFAVLVITHDEPLFWVRFGIGVHVLLGAGLLSWIAYRYHGYREAALACFLCILLNPILFFYARVGLSEGLQFFLLALILSCFYYLHRAKQGTAATLGLSFLSGALVAGLFISKISALAACVALSIGALTAIFTADGSIKQKCLRLVSYGLGALAMLGLYFGIIIADSLPDWWVANISGQASKRVPPLHLAFNIFKVKLADIAYYLSLMPIFGFYLLALPMAMSRERGFLFVLGVVTASVIFIESFFGGDIRRNFFSLSMLSITGGFMVLEYVKNGIRLKLRPFWRASNAGAALVALHMMGMAFLFYWAITQGDKLYIIFCASFLMISLLAYAASQPWQAGTRQALMGVVALMSLIPMTIAAFFTPESRKEVTKNIESLVEPDEFIVGQTTPWGYAGLRRKLIFTNCIFEINIVDFANDMNNIPVSYRYYMSDQPPDNDPCKPADYKGGIIGIYTIFNPGNRGGWMGTSAFWSHRTATYLYER